MQPANSVHFSELRATTDGSELVTEPNTITTQIEFTDENILRGWRSNTCPVHRAVAQAMGVPVSHVVASMTGVGYSEYSGFGRLITLVFSNSDSEYIRSVMAYADAKNIRVCGTTLPARPAATTVMATIVVPPSAPQA